MYIGSSGVGVTLLREKLKKKLNVERFYIVYKESWHKGNFITTAALHYKEAHDFLITVPSCVYSQLCGDDDHHHGDNDKDSQLPDN